MPKNLFNIVFNVGRTFLTPGVLFLISFIIIKDFSKDFWGAFVPFMLLVNLLAHFLQFGSKEQLIRSYSTEPTKIPIHFYKNFFTRFLVLVPFSFLLFIWIPFSYGWILLIWGISLFISQSAESIIIYQKKFKTHFFIELFYSLIILFPFILQTIRSIEGMLLLFAIAASVRSLVMLILFYPKFSGFSISIKILWMCLPFFLIGLSGMLQSRVDQYVIASFSDKTTIASYQIFLSGFILLQSFSGLITAPFNKVLYRINKETFDKFHKKVYLLGIPFVLFTGLIGSILLFTIFDIHISISFFLAGILFAIPPFIYVPIIFLFYRVNREKEVMYLNYIGAAINLVLTVIFVYQNKPFYAIYASMLAQWGMLIWYLIRKKKVLHEVAVSRM